MKRVVLLVVLVLIPLLVLSASAEIRYALVVGNGAYEKTTKLSNPVNDALDIAAILEELGFTVKLQTDVTLTQMEEGIRNFMQQASSANADTTLFFYAGHGVQFEGINYLLPVDADIHHDYELRSKALSMDMVSSALDNTQSSFNLILLDACRDNPFASSRGGARGLTLMGDSSIQNMVVFATKPGSVALDGEGRNSPFTIALKQHITTADLEVGQLIKLVSQSVQEMTRGLQIPWMETSFTGEFYFLTSQQKLAQAELDAERLQKELAVLESEIAMRQTSISAELDERLIQSLQLEQQRAKALENSKELEVLRLMQIREQAAYQLSLHEKELAQKRALEETVVAKREALVQQAEIRRAQLAELDRKRSLTSDAFERLALIANMEKAISVIEASFTESILAMKDEFEGLHQEQVALYRVADPQDPWETEKEFEARLVAYESALVALAETKILEIERQRRTEVENIKRQLEQAKHELQSMQFTLGPTATAVIVSSFDAQNKQFPITIVSTDSLLPLYASLFFKIDSTDRTVLQREFQRVDDADKAKALVGTIRYSLKEVSPSLWSIEVVEAGISSLLEGSKEHPTVLVRCNSQYEIVSNMLTLVDGKVISIPMTYVEGGSFQMGSVTGDDSDEQFVREVLVGSFYMGTYEVTQDIYQAVMGVNPSYHRNARLPVEQVNWYDAIVFANALSKKDGFEEVYTIDGPKVICDWTKKGYRLPTEAEWEYAAKGGRKSKAYTYAGGNNIGNVAWYKDNSGGATHEVGARQGNELGLYDMSGNVWEWCWDWYGSYSIAKQVHPSGPDRGTHQVLRGGDWGNEAKDLRSSNRNVYAPTNRSQSVGFRLVLSTGNYFSSTVDTKAIHMIQNQNALNQIQRATTNAKTDWKSSLQKLSADFCFLETFEGIRFNYDLMTVPSLLTEATERISATYGFLQYGLSLGYVNADFVIDVHAGAVAIPVKFTPKVGVHYFPDYFNLSIGVEYGVIKNDLSLYLASEMTLFILGSLGIQVHFGVTGEFKKMNFVYSLPLILVTKAVV